MPFLTGYRVIDLTDHRGILAGHLLATLGADVIQIEPPEGSNARRMGPFAPDGTSYFWSAYGAGKRSVVLDLAREGDRNKLLSLLADADFLFESASPGELDALGLTRDVISSVNPALIHVSITPFGSDGPKAHWAATDLTLWAAGGPLSAMRDNQGRPRRFSVPQSWLHAAADAAGGALVALSARARSGLGQHVDISAQSSIAQSTLAMLVAQSIGHENYDFDPKPPAGGKQSLDLSGSGIRTRRSKWRTKDGMVELHLGMGMAAGRVANLAYSWLRAAGALPAHLIDWNWQTVPERLEAGEITLADVDAARDVLEPFLKQFDTATAMQEAMQYKVSMAPIYTVGEILKSSHFLARDAFAEIHEGDRTLRMPWSFAKSNRQMFAPPRSAPALGEDSESVLGAIPPEPAPSVEAAGSANLPTSLPRPFEGLFVLDLAWVVAGPAIGRVIADYGSTSVRVETAKRVCTARLIGPFPNGKHDIQRSAIFEECNTGKLGMALDLGTPAGREVVIDLVKKADVLIESFSPGQMARWGLSYETLAEINPGLVMLSTSLLGQTGPLSKFAGYGNAGSAISGFQMLVGNEGELPIGPYGPYTDFIAPRFGLIGVLAALDHKRRTGEGSWIDMSQVEASLQFLAPQLAACSETGHNVTARGNLDDDCVPHDVYPCSGHDQWIAIAIENQEQWARMAELLGGAALDPALGDASERRNRIAEIDGWIASWARDLTPGEAEAMLQASGIPAHRTLKSVDAADDAQFIARKHFVTMDHPSGGISVVEASKFRLSRTPAVTNRVAPSIGRDTAYVLTEILGYDADRQAQLEQEGITA